MDIEEGYRKMIAGIQKVAENCETGSECAHALQSILDQIVEMVVQELTPNRYDSDVMKRNILDMAIRLASIAGIETSKRAMDLTREHDDADAHGLLDIGQSIFGNDGTAATQWWKRAFT